MSSARVLAAFLSLVVALASANPDKPGAEDVDIKAEAKELVTDLQALIAQARSGMAISLLSKRLQGVQGNTSDLIALLYQKVPECETNVVIKLAAAGTGSHAVLSLLLADDEMRVLDGRLALALAFLEHVTRQLQEELSKSNDIGGHLSAIVFGTNATVSIIDSADTAVQAVPYKTSDARRQSGVNLGRGWDLGLGGLSWHSSSGNAAFNLRPTFGPGGFGASAGFSFRF